MLTRSLVSSRILSYTRHFSTTFPTLAKDYYLTKAQNGNLLRLRLKKARQLVGITSLRGTRPENEDQYQAVTLELPAGSQVKTMQREADRVYFGIFDGHGGPVVSEWLANKLHDVIETVSLDDLPQILKTLQTFGGYFRRFPIPKVLQQHVDQQGQTLDGISGSDLSVEQRLTLGFLQADVQCLQYVRDQRNDVHQDREGSTCSVAIVEPGDGKPFWDSQQYDIVIGHVGDTRILLCDASTGEAVSLTTGDHHPNNSSEQDRLRKYAGFVTADSWGDDRILGMLATSRAFGDATLKRYGVSAEPDVVRHSINADNPAAFLVFVTDGITSVMTDQEVVDFVKQHDDPTTAAEKLVDTADQLQSEDNITAMVVRLQGWGTRMHDFTRELRKYKLDNSTMSSRQSW